jgi:hypothetical protein
MSSFAQAQWPEIEALRAKVDAVGDARCLIDSAQRFTALFAAAFDSVVLARVFLVLPLSALPSAERAFATRLAGAKPMKEETRVLCLMGSSGKKPAWNSRAGSLGHLAIPLIDSATVSEAPMVAKLLSDLQVDLKVLDDGRPIATRQMLGGSNGTFFVPDAQTAEDARGRRVIGAREFSEENAVRSVFGMGGSYVDGTLAVAIIFSTERLERSVVDRYPSFISSFKMATNTLVQRRNFFGPPQS